MKNARFTFHTRNVVQSLSADLLVVNTEMKQGKAVSSPLK